MYKGSIVGKVQPGSLYTTITIKFRPACLRHLEMFTVSPDKMFPHTCVAIKDSVTMLAVHYDYINIAALLSYYVMFFLLGHNIFNTIEHWVVF